MKTQFSRPTGASGYALLMVLIITGCIIMILGGVMNRTATIAQLNQRNTQYTACCYAANAAVEQVYARLTYDFMNNGTVTVANNLNIYRGLIPTTSQNSYWGNFQFSDGNGNVNQTYVTYLSNYSGVLPGAWSNRSTTNAPLYRIISNVTYNNGVQTVGTAREDVLLALVPLDTYAIFYNGLMEFTDTASLTINGSVQANGAIYLSPGGTLIFNGMVTATGAITNTLNDGGNSFGGTTTFNGTPSPGYKQYAQTVDVSLNMTNGNNLIEIPPAGEGPLTPYGSEALFNQAHVVLVVTNSPISTNPVVMLTVQNAYNGNVPGDDPSPTVDVVTNATPAMLLTNNTVGLPFLSLTNTFTDQREYQTNMYVTQIDMGKYDSWILTNSAVLGKFPSGSGTYPTILYVADRRNIGTNKLSVVRIVDANQIPYNGNAGFGLATQNPIYIEGNYNIQTNSTQSATGTNDVYSVPAGIYADALTVLSSNWSDALSGQTFSNRPAATTTINAALVMGIVDSTGTNTGQFSGGVENYPRLLENWYDNSAALYLNTSIISLYASSMATNMFRNPGDFKQNDNPYYNPPTRYFYYDTRFQNPNRCPPGMPCALVPLRYNWGQPAPGTH
jgi:hypothetical protein